MRSAAKRPMSGAKQFKSAVPERSGPMDWRGGFERERRKAGQGRAVLSNHRISARTMPLMDLPAGFPRSPKPPKSFNRSELVRALYEHFGANNAEGQGPRLKRREEAERLVNCLLEEIAGALERGMRVELRGLGALNVRAKRERQGRNPRTGEAITIDARRMVRFRASELLLARLNRRSNQRPQRSKPDPRQLAFPIEDQQENRADVEAATAPPLSADRRKTARQRSRL
jgi:integration host factor subunit beta